MPLPVHQQPPGAHAALTPHPATTPAVPPAAAANTALNNFANSAGMQFQLQQGTNALNNLYAAHGMVQSGAAQKGISDYAQHTALNNYFMPYTQMLAGQQNMGASAASSLAGQGSAYAGNMANLGSSYGAAVGAANNNYGSTVTGLGSNLAGSVGQMSQNYGNAVTGINGSMGNAINSGAQNIGNLQLANGQNQANMWGSIGGALGNFASSVVPAPHY